MNNKMKGWLMIFPMIAVVAYAIIVSGMWILILLAAGWIGLVWITIKGISLILKR